MTNPEPTIVCVKDEAEATPEVEQLKTWFARLCADMNEFASERAACRYQMIGAQTGRFTISSPFDQDQHISCYETAVIHEAFAFHFHSLNETLWLVTCETTDGYQIVGCFLPKRNFYITLQPHFNNSVPYWNSILREIEQNPTGNAIDSANSVLLIGHGNYAHFFWNQLSGLLQLENLSEIKVDKIVATHEPILPIEKLVELKTKAPIVQDIMSSLRGNRGLHPGFVFSMGSTLVAEATKRRLTERCTRYADDLGSTGFEKHGLVIWLSLRLRDRHATNIEEAALAILKKLEAEEIDVTVLLDGFSEPNDIDFPHRYLLDLNTSQRRAIRILARSLMERAKSLDLRHVSVIDIANFDTPAAIAAARHADFYFCHHGTQQHKVGWIYNIPGLIHANRSVINLYPGHWMQYQCNSPHRPVYVPLELIRDIEPKNDLQASNSYYHDYEFQNLDGLADFFIETLRGQTKIEIKSD